MSKKIPDFKSDKEAAEFWDRTDYTDYTDESKEVELNWKPAEDTCPHCGSQMKTSLVDINLLNQKIYIRKMKIYSCPVCKKYILSEDARKEISRIGQSLMKDIPQEISSKAIEVA